MVFEMRTFIRYARKMSDNMMRSLKCEHSLDMHVECQVTTFKYESWMLGNMTGSDERMLIRLN